MQWKPVAERLLCCTIPHAKLKNTGNKQFPVHKKETCGHYWSLGLFMVVNGL